MSDVPKTLYHYCTTDTFHKIIMNRSVRLSSLNLSNDTMEGRWANERLIDACIRAKINPVEVERLRDFLDIMPEVYGMLGLCLSSEPDMLSQWRGYADDGYGFCVGFNSRKLMNSVRGKIGGTLLRIEYDKEKQIQQLTRLARDITKQVNAGALQAKVSTILTQGKWETTRWAEIDEAMRLFQNHLQMHSLHLYTMKNPAFSEEREWRQVSPYVPLSQLNGEWEYRAGRDRISPYREVKFDGDGEAEGMIDVVYVGPRNITTDTVLNAFTRKYLGDNVEIRRSEASYR